MIQKLSNIVPSLLLLLLIIFPIYSSSKAEAVNEEKQFFNKFFRATGVKSQHNQQLNTLVYQYQQGFAAGLNRQAGQAAITDKEKKDKIRQLMQHTVGQYVAKMKAAMVKEMQFEALVDHVYYPAYSKYFSVSEIKKIIAFYESPAGRKFVSGTPALLQQTTLIFNQKYGTRLRELNKRIAGEELAKFKPELEKLEKKSK